MTIAVRSFRKSNLIFFKLIIFFSAILKGIFSNKRKIGAGRVQSRFKPRVWVWGEKQKSVGEQGRQRGKRQVNGAGTGIEKSTPIRPIVIPNLNQSMALGNPKTYIYWLCISFITFSYIFIEKCKLLDFHLIIRIIKTYILSLSFVLGDLDRSNYLFSELVGDPRFCSASFSDHP